MKSYAVYKNKAINEISKDNVFIVRLPKNLNSSAVEEKIFSQKKFKSEEKSECQIIDKENYWYFLACYTSTVHLRNYVIFDIV